MNLSQPKSRQSNSYSRNLPIASSIYYFVWILLLFVMNPPNIILVYSMVMMEPTKSSSTTNNRAQLTTSSETKYIPSFPQNKHATVANSALLRISYDGRRFTGWSAANNSNSNNNNNNSTKSTVPISNYDGLTTSERRKMKQGKFLHNEPRKGFVRPVQEIIQTNLSRLYGNADPNRIVVEGCSRTDKGVHATFMIAQIYCMTKQSLQLQQQIEKDDSKNYDSISSIPGRRMPHPKCNNVNNNNNNNNDDSDEYDSFHFDPLPMNGNLPKIAYALNRMLPSDVRIVGIAPIPTKIPDNTNNNNNNNIPFHPTINSVSKTYEYKISLGPNHDPTCWRFTWHVGNEPSFDINKVNKLCQEVLKGTHDFKAFQGAPRGIQDKQKRELQKHHADSTICTLMDIQILNTSNQGDHLFSKGDHITNSDHPLQSFTISITGDRFLYKMMRFLVGAIVAVGCNKLSISDVQKALDTGTWFHQQIIINDTSNIDTGSSRKQFDCAPAHGLVLHNVQYKEHLDWQPVMF